MLFTAPTGGPTAREMYEKRLTWITDDVRSSARELGCTFHRAWYTADASSRREVAIFREGDVGLVPLGGD